MSSPWTRVYSEEMPGRFGRPPAPCEAAPVGHGTDTDMVNLHWWIPWTPCFGPSGMASNTPSSADGCVYQMALNFSIALNVWHGVCGFVCTCGWYGLLMHCVMALAWWCIARAFSAFNHYFIAMRQHHTADFICCLHLNETAKSQMRNKHKMDGHQSATPNASSWILLQDVIDTLPQPCHHFAPTVVPPDPFMLQRLLRRQAL